MSDPQLADVARVCNRYPDIEVNFDVTGGETVTAGEPVQINVFMERTLPEGQELAPVHCPRCVSDCYFPMFLQLLCYTTCLCTGCEMGLLAQYVAPCNVSLILQWVQGAQHICCLVSGSASFASQHLQQQQRPARLYQDRCRCACVVEQCRMDVDCQDARFGKCL